MAARKSLRTLQDAEVQSREVLAKKRQRYQEAQHALREAETKALNRRRFLVGKMVLGTVLGTLPLDEMQAWILDTAKRYQMRLDGEAGVGQNPDEGQGVSAPSLRHCSHPRISDEIPPNGIQK